MAEFRELIEIYRTVAYVRTLVEEIIEELYNTHAHVSYNVVTQPIGAKAPPCKGLYSYWK